MDPVMGNWHQWHFINHPHVKLVSPQSCLLCVSKMENSLPLKTSFVLSLRFQKILGIFLKTKAMHSYTVKMYSRFENLLPNEGSKNGFEHSPHHWRKCRGSRCANLVMICVLTITLLSKFTLYKYLHLLGLSFWVKYGIRKNRRIFLCP